MRYLVGARTIVEMPIKAEKRGRKYQCLSAANPRRTSAGKGASETQFAEISLSQ